MPSRLAENCRSDERTAVWLSRLPKLVEEFSARWQLTVGDPFDAGAGWVAPARRASGEPCVLKIGMPHMEARDEIAGLSFWGGGTFVRLLEADEPGYAMILERCLPGRTLHQLPEVEQDVVIAELLGDAWQSPPEGHPFRPLAFMLDVWADEARESGPAPADPALFQAGLDVYRSLSRDRTEEVTLVTDLHAGNVLSATRSPWLAIDPKPFVGDPAWDTTQHLLNCTERLHRDPVTLTDRVARLAGVEPQRVRWWTFARIVVNGSQDPRAIETARALAP